MLFLWPCEPRVPYYVRVQLLHDTRDRLGSAGRPGSGLLSLLPIRWPGDGSFRVGGGVSHYRFGDKKLEPFDWGGRFFKAPQLDPPGAVANQLGFQFIRKQYEDAWTIEDGALQKPSEFWVAVSSLLPALLFAFSPGFSGGDPGPRILRWPMEP